MVCAVCGESFVSQRSSALYCSGRCRKRAQRRVVSQEPPASPPSEPLASEPPDRQEPLPPSVPSPRDDDDEIPPDPDWGEVAYVGGVLTIRDAGESVVREVVRDGWPGG